jgi:hypothetical protein
MEVPVGVVDTNVSRIKDHCSAITRISRSKTPWAPLRMIVSARYILVLPFIDMQGRKKWEQA